MNYIKIYENLIEKCKCRIIDVDQYYENHHIKPKCLGGDNTNSNLVKLTYREHLLAHWLLHNIYPENIKLHRAFNFMAYGEWNIKEYKKTINSRMLEMEKIQLVKTFSTKQHTQKVLDGWCKKRLKAEKKKAKLDEKKFKLKLKEEQKIKLDKEKKEEMEFKPNNTTSVEWKTKNGFSNYEINCNGVVRLKYAPEAILFYNLSNNKYCMTMRDDFGVFHNIIISDLLNELF